MGGDAVVAALLQLDLALVVASLQPPLPNSSLIISAHKSSGSLLRAGEEMRVEGDGRVRLEVGCDLTSKLRASACASSLGVKRLEREARGRVSKGEGEYGEKE